MEEEEDKSHWMEEMEKIQKEENESVEKKELIKKELIDCEALLKKCDDRRNVLREQLRCLEKKGVDFVKRRNEIIAKFKNSSCKSNDKSIDVEESKRSTESKESIKVESKECPGLTSNVPVTRAARVVSIEDQSGKLSITKNIKQEIQPKIETTSKMLEQSTPPPPSLKTQQQVPKSKDEMKSKVKRQSDTKTNSTKPISSKKPKVSSNPVIEVTIENDDSPVLLEEHEPERYTTNSTNKWSFQHNSILEAGTASKHDLTGVMMGITPGHVTHDSRRETHYLDPRIPPGKYRPGHPVFALDRLPVSKTNKPPDRSISYLQAIEGYIYVSCRDGTVKRYNIHNSNDLVEYKDHSDAAVTLFVDLKRQLLLTGSKSGYFRCFKLLDGSLLGSKSLYSQIQSIFEAWNRIFVALSNGTVIQLEYQLSDQLSEQLSETNEKFKMKDRILSIHPLNHEFDKQLLILPVNSKPVIVNAMSGVIYKTLYGADVTFFPAFIQSHGCYCLTATGIGSMPLDSKKSVIHIYDIFRDWQIVTCEFQRGVITATHMYHEFLYVAILIRGATRIHCYSIPDLRIVWIMYLNPERVFGLTVDGPYIFVGSESGEISSFSPELDGPFHCGCRKCGCRMPFARKCDLETHAKRYFQ